jgi:membrane peptidoglycan carboxypeptidase
MLQGVVNYGTGTAAQLPGWQVAGKTGTTENYGDAWFVGFTAPPADPTQPQLVTAVWVGYPNNLVPMLKLFHNGPVEGGTYPALIWKAYTQRALAYLRETPTGFPAANVPSSAPSTVTFGDDYGNTGVLALDNGYCKITASIEFFVGQAPSQTAHCLKDAVEVPNVHGWTLSAAESQLAGQPLQWHVATRPARPGARPGIVVGERIPPRDVASAYTTIDLVVSAPRHGVVPNLVGLSLDRARALLARKRMRVVTRGATSGRVVAQRPAPGVAAGPGLQAVLTLRPEKGG